MQYKKLLIILPLSFLLSGCAAPKTLQATGGSRADGTVELSFEYTQFEEPQPNWELAKLTAVEKCKAWNYKSAEKFGGFKDNCQISNNYGCVKHLVTISYQCTN